MKLRLELFRKISFFYFMYNNVFFVVESNFKWISKFHSLAFFWILSSDMTLYMKATIICGGEISGKPMLATDKTQEMCYGMSPDRAGQGRAGKDQSRPKQGMSGQIMT